MTVVGALQGALEVEHQAVYGYGLLAARSPLRRDRGGVDRAGCLARLAEHQLLRDRIAGLVHAAGARPVAAAAAYVPPFPVDRRTRAFLGMRVEQAAAGAAWDLVAATAADGAARRLAVAALTGAAGWTARWAAAAAAAPPPLPGRPGQRLAVAPAPGSPSQPSTTSTTSSSP